jgi:hypothetical protein
MTLFETAQTISRIWEEVLHLDQVGLYDHFYDLGGDPRLLEQMRRRLQISLRTEVTLVDLCRYPTVMALARYYAGVEDGASSVSDSYERAQRQRLLMAQRYPVRLRLAATQI